MTICIAALMNWHFNDQTDGFAVLVASDRKITFGDIEYEAPKQKVGALSKHVLMMAAGDMVIHSEAIGKAQKEIEFEAITDVGDIAQIYAKHIREIKSRRAAQLYLSPLGLTLDEFMLNQNQFAPSFVEAALNQLQAYEVNVEAIIAGSDQERASIYFMDRDGLVTCHNDIGFAVAGLGAPHARSHFLYSRYATFDAWYPKALFVAYFAKKRAEVAPGVGRETDLHIVNRDGAFPVDPRLKAAVSDIYEKHEAKRAEMAAEGIKELTEIFLNVGEEPAGSGSTLPGTTASGDDK